MLMDDVVIIKERRLKTDLKISGLGYVAFGIWSFIKFLIQVTADYSVMFSSVSDVDIYSPLFMGILIAISAIVFAIVIPLYLYIGLSAMRYANGKKQLRIFPAIIVVLMIISVLEIPAYIEEILKLDNMLMANTASLLLQLTSIFVLFDMLRCTLGLRKIRKARAEAAG